MGILGLALPLLGVSGATAAALYFIGPAKIMAFLASVPTKVWIGLGIAALLVVGTLVHQRKAHAALAAEYARGKSDEDKAWQEQLDKAHADAMQWKAKADAAGARISQEERAKNEAERDAIAARADNQRMRGPGRAAAPDCGRSGNAGLPAASGGHVTADRGTDAGLAGVPAEQPMAIVPWNDLTGWAATSDGWRSEALTWRAWYAREAKQWQDAKAAAPKLH